VFFAASGPRFWFVLFQLRESPTATIAFVGVGTDNALPFLPKAVVFLLGSDVPTFKEPSMEWTTPQHEEIDLNCEISSYANAEL
jgi:hypothetical protein